MREIVIMHITYLQNKCKGNTNISAYKDNFFKKTKKKHKAKRKLVRQFAKLKKKMSQLPMCETMILRCTSSLAL